MGTNSRHVLFFSRKFYPVFQFISQKLKFRSELFLSHSKIWYVDPRINSDFRSRSLDLFSTYVEVMDYIRTKVCFALFKSSVLCLRGCRSLKRQPEIVGSAIGAILEEGRLVVEPPHGIPEVHLFARFHFTTSNV